MKIYANKKNLDECISHIKGDLSDGLFFKTSRIFAYGDKVFDITVTLMGEINDFEFIGTAKRSN
jgi:hypothetical protein